VQAQRRDDFTEEQQNKAQERNGNEGSNADVGRLAEAAVRFVVAAGVGVRHHLQQEEERNQSQREGHASSQSAISPGVCQPNCAACVQKRPFRWPGLDSVDAFIVIYKENRRKNEVIPLS